MLIHFYNFVDKIKNSPARRDKWILILIGISIIFNALLWAFLYWQLKKIININPEFTTIALHYNVFFGIDEYGKWTKAFIMPLMGLIILLINSILAFIFYSKKNLLSYFLMIITFISQLSLFGASLLIVLINL